MRLAVKPVFVLILLSFGLMSLTGCGTMKLGFSKAVAVDKGSPSANSGETAAEPKPEGTVSIRVSFAGDIMVHASQLAAAYNNRTGTYSFAGYFDDLQEYLRSDDLTMGNLETTLAGPAGGYSGYPRFNSPTQILDALKEAGFDVLTNANNHSMDSGAAGVLKTIAALDASGIRHTGTAASQAELDRPLIVEVKGIKVGILAYTYGTNGLPVPKGKEYLVNLLNPDRIKADIRQLREKGADIVVVCPHFGVEYARKPRSVEQRLVDEICQAGADVVAGSHPHVLQPMVKRDSQANPEGLFAAYSLGNFISGQRTQYRDSAVILSLTLKKDLATGKISLGKAEYIPTWVHRYRVKGKTGFRVVAVEKAIRDYEQGLDSRLTADDYARLKQVWQEITKQLSGPDSPELRHV